MNLTKSCMAIKNATAPSFGLLTVPACIHTWRTDLKKQEVIICKETNNQIVSQYFRLKKMFVCKGKKDTTLDHF